MDIQEYEQEARKDFEVEITTINSYCLRMGYILSKWSRYLYNEEMFLNDIESELSAIYKSRLYYYSYEAPEKIDKKQLDSFVNGDPEYVEKKRELKAQQNLVNFVNNILKALSNQSYYINNCIKHLEWQEGR